MSIMVDSFIEKHWTFGFPKVFSITVVTTEGIIGNSRIYSSSKGCIKKQTIVFNGRYV
jgi:hypothetical protein